MGRKGKKPDNQPSDKPDGAKPVGEQPRNQPGPSGQSDHPQGKKGGGQQQRKHGSGSESGGPSQGPLQQQATGPPQGRPAWPQGPSPQQSRGSSQQSGGPSQAAWPQAPAQQQSGGPPQAAWPQAPAQQQSGGPSQQRPAWPQGSTQPQKQSSEPRDASQQSGQKQSRKQGDKPKGKQEHPKSDDSQQKPGPDRPQKQQQQGDRAKGKQEHQKSDDSQQKPEQKPGPDKPQKQQQQKQQKPDIKSEAESRASTPASSGSAEGLKPFIPSSATMQIAQAKMPGTKGRRVKIEANYLELILDRMISKGYHYDIAIDPDKPRRLMFRVFEAFKKEHFQHKALAFDGQKNIFSIDKLNIGEKFTVEVKITDDETMREKKYKVTIQEARNSLVQLDSLKSYQKLKQYDAPARALQFFDIIFKYGLSGRGGVMVGRSFFKPPERPFDLGDYYHLWVGIFQSTILGNKPYLNVDVSHKAFPAAISILEILHTLRADPNRDLTDRDKLTIRNHLKGLNVVYKLPKSPGFETYKFNDLKDSARRLKFKSDESNTMMTVEDYFKQKKGIALQFPNLPCLWVGSTIRNVCLPMEFCSVAPGQNVKKKCTENQTRAMIKEAATSTDVRKQKIMNILNQLKPNESEILRQCGIGVGKDFITIDARILEAPKIEYKNGRAILPTKGQWRGDRFLKPAVPLTKWAIMPLDNRTHPNQIREFAQLLIRMSGDFDLSISPDYYMCQLRSTRDNDIENEMNNLKKQEVQLLIVVIPDRGDTYQTVKQIAELRCGILTQCIKGFTVQRKGTDPSTISNILLKVNTKLNGTNHKIQPQCNIPILLKGGAYMVIGGDVTHPSPDQQNIPSVVGVAASHDINAFTYNACWRLQDPKQEVIKDFSEIMLEHLRFFQGKHKILPSRIIYYRDGVSEGQFQDVLNVEYNSMCQAFQSIKPDYKPLVTFIVVQKRHHTRFFPGNSRISNDRNNNVPPGTIVDTEIVHPNETQFFLVSHQSIQGVAKPTKYCLLKDDSNFSMDDLQSMTYNLCHMFARCNRSVSYPAPTYYAHHVASRGRNYIDDKTQLQMGNLKREFEKRTVKPFIIKDHPMFFV